MSAADVARRWLPPPEYLLNHVVNRIPLVGARMAAYEALGVHFADRTQAAIMLTSEVWAPRRLRIGTDSIVGRDCLLDARGGITLGDHVNVSTGVRMMSAKHRIDEPGFPAEFSPIVIEDEVWVALGATILGGVTIGRGAVVAAGAVVTGDVPPRAVVTGIPARPVRERAPEGDQRVGYRPNWL